MRKVNRFICIFLIIQYYCNVNAKRNNNAQEGLQEISNTADSMDKELTKTGNSIGNLFKNIKGIFKKTSKDFNDDDNSDALQSCKNQVKEINNKFNIIYDYANNKLKDILNNKNQKTVDSMYNAIAQLQSIWNSIINLQTAEQVSQFLKTHNQFYNSMNQYLNSNQTSNNTKQNQYNTKYLNNNQNKLVSYTNNNNTYSKSSSSNIKNLYSTNTNNNNVKDLYNTYSNVNSNNKNKYNTKYSVKNLYNNLTKKSNTKQIKQPNQIKSITTNKNNDKKKLWQRIKIK